MYSTEADGYYNSMYDLWLTAQWLNMRAERVKCVKKESITRLTEFLAENNGMCATVYRYRISMPNGYQFVEFSFVKLVMKCLYARLKGM